jgi:mannosyltransferase
MSSKPARAEPGRPKATLAWLGCILVAAAVLRILWLDRSELWFDEAFAALVAFESPREIVSEMARDSSPPLYYLLLHAWIAVAGWSPLALRLFSVVAGVAAVLLCGVLGKHLWGDTAGIGAAALLALSPLHIYYSREVRPYALLTVFVLASVLALEALRTKRRSASATLAYIAATTCAVYVHGYGLFLVGVLAVWIACGWVPRMTGSLAGGAVLLAYAPWIGVIAGQIGAGATSWVADLWEATPPPLALFKSLAVFSIGGAAPEYIALNTDAVPGLLRWASYGLFTTLTAAALASTRLRDAGQAQRIMTAIGVLLGLPFLLSFVTPMYLVGRYDVIALPLFLLVCARGATAGRPLAIGAGILIAALATTSLVALYRQPPLEGVEREAALLVHFAAAGDRVLCTGFTRNALEYYARRGGARQPFSSFPRSFGSHRGWVDQRELADAAAIARDASETAAALAASLRGVGRLWIAHSRQLQDVNDVLMARIAGSFDQIGCPGAGESQGFTCWQPK